MLLINCCQHFYYFTTSCISTYYITKCDYESVLFSPKPFKMLLPVQSARKLTHELAVSVWTESQLVLWHISYWTKQSGMAYISHVRNWTSREAGKTQQRVRKEQSTSCWIEDSDLGGEGEPNQLQGKVRIQRCYAFSCLMHNQPKIYVLFFPWTIHLLCNNYFLTTATSNISKIGR